MKILFDQGTPAPLRHHLEEHEVKTAHKSGRAELSNGDLLTRAESNFDLLITTDQKLQYQQNLSGKNLAILVLPTTSWFVIQQHTTEISEAISAMKPGDFQKLQFPKDH